MKASNPTSYFNNEKGKELFVPLNVLLVFELLFSVPLRMVFEVYLSILLFRIIAN